MNEPRKKGLTHVLQEFSIPLIVGVLAAQVFANVAPEAYLRLVTAPFGGSLLGHPLTARFFVNELFMVFFFGIAAKEITESTLPGGSLNPLRRAINPLLATVGGVLGPVGVFFAILASSADAYGPEHGWAELQRGWGIPTATDIALAWLVARTVFGQGHPAIGFLLLLAIVDDGIGLAIIAIFYGDSAHPAEPAYLGLVAAGMGLAFALRKLGVRAWLPYVLFAGPLCWAGLVLGHLHPALALVFVVPFMPGPRRDTGLFEEAEAEAGRASGAGRSTLHEFEHQFKLFVDLGLFFFGFCNAGVQFVEIGPMTWTVLAALVVGKTLGVSLFSLLASALGFPRPAGMGLRELGMAGFIASLGLTVALFVAGAAFPGDAVLLGQAKMGALFSGCVAFAALVLGKALGMKRGTNAASPDGAHGEQRRAVG